MSKKTYNLHLKGYVGGWDFDSDYVDFVLNKNADNEVHVLIDSLGGSLATALSIVASFRNHGNVHFVCQCGRQWNRLIFYAILHIILHMIFYAKSIIIYKFKI